MTFSWDRSYVPAQGSVFLSKEEPATQDRQVQRGSPQEKAARPWTHQGQVPGAEQHNPLLLWDRPSPSQALFSQKPRAWVLASSLTDPVCPAGPGVSLWELSVVLRYGSEVGGCPFPQRHT